MTAPSIAAAAVRAGETLARGVGAACRAVLIGIVQGYRYLLKPWLGNACRFEPTCSAYALDALRAHGAWRGAALTGWRLARCHPWCDGGHDPVPAPRAPGAAAGAAADGRLFTRLLEAPPPGAAADPGPTSPTP